jgi:hypothetical protein
MQPEAKVAAASTDPRDKNLIMQVLQTKAISFSEVRED